MKWIARVAIMGALMAVLVNAAEAETSRFFVQLIHSGNGSEALPAGVRRVGARLKERLGGAFKARDYWEMKREEVLVSPGRAATVALSPERSVQIRISAERRTVTAYYRGRAVEHRSGPRGDGITLIGDNRGGGLWFVVVRRDKPGS
jgi:hypothetical protein